MERILIGIPTLVITVAENQIEFIEDLNEDNFIYIRSFLTLEKCDIINKIDFIVENKAEVKKYKARPKFVGW